MDAMQTMIKARSSLLMDNPFFGVLSLRLKLEEDGTAETMWTDGESIGFNPIWVNELKLHEVKGVVAHEVLHVALNHTTRRGNRDNKEWNIACDYAVNALLKESNFEIPQGGLFDAKFKEMSAEAIHKTLFGDKQEDSGKQEGGKDKGQQQGQQQTSAKGKLGNAGEVRDFKGGKATEAEKAEKEQQTQIEQIQSANLAEKAGNLPGGVKEHVTALNEPKVDWKEALNRFITQQVKNDYTFKRINTRYAGSGIMLPSLYNNTLAPVLLAVDTSGSITKADKKQFATEIEEIINQFNVQVDVVYCDIKIRGEQSFNSDNLPVTLDAQGGGGTKFSPVMNSIPTREVDPCCVIYLTDLLCDDFGKEPDCEVLWIQTRGRIRKNVPFGEVVIM